ncbi:hypothetical protein DFJ74DRAFT_692073 [Hyaloraphidium curvatum]|nr:hypothetical protein DFJ74DRAFT_692073 [Hyaloraphidium curvatum]
MLPGRVRDALYTRLAADAGSDAGAPNDKWIAGFLDALDGAGAELESFTLSTGGKLYGMHLGPALWAGYSLPFDEDRSRCPGTMSYTVAEAAVREHASRRGFKCSFVRPGFIVGLPRSFPPGLQNLGLNIAVYASLLKAMGKPLAFPGCAAAYARKDSFATPARIAEVAAWAALDGPEGEAFNAVSAQGTPWEETWAAIARWFRMPPRGPADQVRGTSAVELLGGREAAEEAWARVRAGNPGMLDVPLGSLLNGFLDLSFVHPHDSEFSLEKLRAHGFAGAEGLPPPGEMWGSFLEEAVRARVVPAPA